MAIPETPGIAAATGRLKYLLSRARELKPNSDIEPPLPTFEFQGEMGLPMPLEVANSHYLAALEYAARRIYQDIASKVSISDPEFVEIWNLFDILNICGDQLQCEPSLVWWLIEELLETQSIDDCRVVFNYLESRRERLVTRHFWRKRDMVVLRAFNELLRRLSRAEESVFCGRVFLFMFQSFPLGTRSSVNGKGDFHVENVTSFEPEDLRQEDEITDGDMMTGVENTVVKDAGDTSEAGATLLQTEATLYPAFWNMQRAFSNPPEYFKQNGITEFKATLESTLSKFNEVPKVNQAAADNRRGVKRKSGEVESQDKFATTFNPKYLTSRELFTLELSDLAFQRHILVQALILLDFLLSLTDKAKKRSLAIANNKSLNFEYTLSDLDAEWAEKTRSAISVYLTEKQLKGDQEGKYYHRLVETVLSRDKNWVRWKLEFCKEIKRPAVVPDDFSSAQDGAKRACKPINLKSSPMGALDLKFLQESGASEMGRVHSETTRSILPDAQTLVKDVQGADLDLEMATTEEEREGLQDAKMSKTWRALRLMSKTKLSLFDKVDDGRNLECFIQPHGAATINIEGGEMTENGGDATDSRPEDDSQGQAQAGPVAMTATTDEAMTE